jgi:hypothetical protein
MGTLGFWVALQGKGGIERLVSIRWISAASKIPFDVLFGSNLSRDHTCSLESCKQFCRQKFQ